MAVVTVAQSVVNAAPDTLAYELAVIVNALQAELAALAAKLDADAGVTDVNYNTVVGNTDTLSFRETGTPS